MVPREFGHYRLESLLGRGGMGEVYRARDLRHDREVAVKLLSEKFAGDQLFLRRFRWESHLVARLRHPHVIPVHDFGEIDGRHYLDMRLVDGADLGSILVQDGPLPPERAVHLVGQIAAALDAAHADGLVHRDVKPSNALVTEDDFVYVVDFGLARPVAGLQPPLTTTGVTVGTLGYMAPERFHLRSVDHRADVYSLACVLYQCLTAQPPFPAEDGPRAMHAHLHAEPPAPSDLADAVPAGLDAVVARGMAKEPDDRYPSAGALAASARAALATPGVPRSATTVHVPAPAAAPEQPEADRRTDELAARPAAPRPARRTTPRGRRLMIAGTAVALAATVVGVGVVDLGAADGEPPARPQAGPVADRRPAAAPSIPVPTVVGQVDVGATPGHVEVAPNGRVAYVANREARVITVLDTVLGQVVATIPVPEGPPRFVTFSPDGRRAYVSIFDEPGRTISAVAVLDTATNTVTSTVPVGRVPFATSVSPDGRILYVPAHDEARIDVVDLATDRVVGQIPTARNPHWVSFGTDGRFAYTPNHESNLVSVIDVARGSVVAEIPVGVSPHAAAVSPDGTRVAVVNYDNDELSVIDTATNAVVDRVRVGANPQDVTYAADGRHVYTANSDDDTISVVDTATNTVTATIGTGEAPTSVAVLPDGRQAYVTNLRDGTVWVLNVTAL